MTHISFSRKIGLDDAASGCTAAASGNEYSGDPSGGDQASIAGACFPCTKTEDVHATQRNTHAAMHGPSLSHFIY